MKKRVLILSGPTHEYIDPVRFIGNASSGKMGAAIAEEARRRGYQVEFITGPVDGSNLPELEQSSIHRIVGAEEMLSTARDLFSAADIIVFAAAVADYAPAEKRIEKMAKSEAELILHLRPTPDIAKTLCAARKPSQTAIGFALQTANGEDNARRKLTEKNLNGIVLNTPATLGAENGTFSFLAQGRNAFSQWGNIDKPECAKRIFDAIEDIVDGRC